ncbi:GAF domain-containing sensor histidine kinase [Noviherbaspirillum denitrificans]|nr:GAF domain-containing sensor histidine kinase [Noviherbaspirillum denitrificans]
MQRKDNPAYLAESSAFGPEDDRQKMLEERATELARAYDVLRNSVERVSADQGIGAILDAFLLEAMSFTGAAGGEIFTVRDGFFDRTVCVGQDGRIVPFAEWKDEPIYIESPTVWNRDPASVSARLMQTVISVNGIDPLASWWPAAHAYHEKRGHVQTWNVPFVSRGQLMGYLCLAFRDHRPLTEMNTVTLTALAQQAALAVDLTQIAAKASDAAIASERAAAAERRAETLERLNRIMQNALAQLTEDPVRDDFLAQSLALCADQLGAAGVSVWRRNPVTRVYEMAVNVECDAARASASAHPGLDGAEPMVPVLEPYEKGKITTHHASQLFSLPASASYADYIASRDIQTVMSVPLFLGETLLGLMTLRFCNDRTLTPEEEDLVHSLVNQSVLALELTRLSRSARVSAVLEERRRMAREIHDGIAQAFLGIILQIERGRQSDDIAARDARLLDLARHGLADARRAVEALRPQSLSSHDLPRAVAQLLQQEVSRLGFTPVLEVSGQWMPLEADRELHLYRIVQEAVNNVASHAHATELRVEISSNPDEVSILIVDNGVGFPASAPGDRGFGMESMHQRAALAAATLSVLSQPGRGTQVFVAADRRQGRFAPRAA